MTPVFSDLEANRHDGERERNGGKANGKCKRDHHGIPLCNKDAPGPVNEKQTQTQAANLIIAAMDESVA